MTENEISYIVRGAIYEVYNEFGPGLFEKVYEKILQIRLRKRGLSVKAQVVVPLIVDGIVIDSAFKADLIVEEKVIVEIKSIDAIGKVQHMQLLTYLRLSKLKLGILVNFNTDEISKSIFRKVNNL
ncbi:MAG: GxxExxY protein [Bacteroidetes bacterium]|nr:GxxExxY protein [Bacteroidota bacterium]